MSKATFDDTFSSFIDHYILLLAARFKAPLDLLLDDQPENGDCTSAEAHSRWNLVARCVQDELDRPRTAEERQNVTYLDVAFFTGDVCRERALYLQWKMQSRQVARGRQTASSVPGEPGPSKRPSAFDVTRNSITDRVSAIFADVRGNLPTSLLSRDESSDDDDDETVAVVGSPSHSANGTTGPRNASVMVREVFVPTEEEKRRDAALATAKDNLLSQVQALQVKFYEEHRRWIDVPYESLELKPRPLSENKSEAVPSTSVRTVAKQQSEEVERAELLAALRGDLRRDERRSGSSGTQASPLQRMRETVHVERPARPSEQTEDAIMAMYQNAAAACESEHVAADQKGVAVAAPLQKAVPKSMRATSITKETAVPTGRHQRWQIMEYEEDPDDDSDGDE